MHTYIDTMTKCISLSDEAYKDLTLLKKGGESFSEVIRKLTENERKKERLSIIGLWKDDKEMDNIFKEIFKKRHSSKSRSVSW